MKKAVLYGSLFLFLLSLYSCGKSKELESCEYDLTQTQNELQSMTAKKNQLENQYNDLLSYCEQLKSNLSSVEDDKSSLISSSKSEINDIIRKIDWNSYNSKEEILNDLKDISIMHY